MLIGKPLRPKVPGVKATIASARQFRLAFNSFLSRRASLQDYPFMASDREDQRLTFIPTRQPEKYGDRVYPLIRDGGGPLRKTAGRALFVHQDFLPELGLQVGRFYPAEIGRNGIISISLAPAEPVPVHYAAPEEISSRVRGVYFIRDVDRTIIDIGCSESDVRGRVRMKWKQQSEAASVSVCETADYLHWERVFQNRFEEEHGRLPRHNRLKGKRCGCHECNGGVCKSDLLEHVGFNMWKPTTVVAGS